MSNNLINRSGAATAGSHKVFTNIPVLNTEGYFDTVSVNLESIGNRKTLDERIAKYLKNGWDWNLFSNVIVANFTDGPLKGQQRILDGDHRRHMYKLTFPDQDAIPAYIIDVSSIEEYHLLFAKLNWEQRKQANAEEVFIHKVLGKDDACIQLAKDLAYCGLSVYGSPDAGGTVGDVIGPNVKIGAFKRSLKSGQNNVKAAASVISDAWPEDRVQGELLEGVTILYATYDALSDGSKVQKDFERWFTDIVSIDSQYLIARDFKNAGGAVHHRHGASIAKGILDAYRRVELKNGCSKKWKQKMLPVGSINRMLEK